MVASKPGTTSHLERVWHLPGPVGAPRAFCSIHPDAPTCDEWDVDRLCVESTEACHELELAGTPAVLVGMGLIQRFAWPSGYITGVAALGVELTPKRLEIFREFIPSLKWVLFPLSIRE
jgi:hypothetical protein